MAKYKVLQREGNSGSGPVFAAHGPFDSKVQAEADITRLKVVYEPVDQFANTYTYEVVKVGEREGAVVEPLDASGATPEQAVRTD